MSLYIFLHSFDKFIYFRWKYTWAGIVYITDASSTVEVTSYAESIEIPTAELTSDDVAEHEASKERIRRDPSLCTSHTVIVVDQSGSMRTSDVFDFKNRSQAVFGMLALDFVAKQRLSGEASATDVVSLVLMHDEAEVAFEREPMGLILYNKFVDLHNNGVPRSHGNFLPALELAQSLLEEECHGSCAMSLLFLSDGKPSDPTEKLYPSGPPREELIASEVASLAESFGQQLSVSTLGFANRDQDFSVLEKMAKAAQDAGASGEFHRPELSSAGLGTAIARTVSSLTATRTRLTLLAEQSGPRRPVRQVARERAGGFWDCVPTRGDTDNELANGEGVSSGWVIRNKKVERWKYVHRRRDDRRDPWMPRKFHSDQADCVAIRRKSLGEGAERIVFGLRVCAYSQAVWSDIGELQQHDLSVYNACSSGGRVTMFRGSDSCPRAQKVFCSICLCPYILMGVPYASNHLPSIVLCEQTCYQP